MDAPRTTLNAVTASVGAAWSQALPPFGILDGEASTLVSQMSDAGLLRLLDDVVALGRRVDALTAMVAGAVAVRSPIGSGAEGPAHRAGFASPARLIAASSGGPVSRAALLATVGSATAVRCSLAGELLPPAHPHVAVALAGGGIGVEAAHLIIAMLERVSHRAHPADLDAAEQVLAAQAESFTLEELTRLVKRAEALLDPDGVEPREDVLHEGRHLVVSEDRKGRIQLRGTFDPETGAPIKAALEAYVERALRVARGHNHPAEVGAGVAQAMTGDGAATTGETSVSQPVMAETRTVGQIRADALADFARHVLACEDRVPGLPATTVVVRVDLEDLEERLGGSGFASIDGLDQPVSARTARRAACSAGLVPAVLGGVSMPLDLGREARLFTRYQVLALWGRDGGCAACGQTVFVEAHHTVGWAEGGPTDLSAGVLLCSRCHHRVHRDDWEIHVDDGGKVWFLPPPQFDPGRIPRPGVSRQTPRERTRQQRERLELLV